jgi:hypothetical protein
MSYMQSMPNAPSFSLIGRSGAIAGRNFTGAGDQVIVGREKDCQLLIESPNISRHHARFTFINGQWTIEDLQSSNGTFVNGMRLGPPQYIRPGDTINLGSLQFTFQPAPVGAPQVAQTMVEAPAQYPSHSPAQAAPYVLPAQYPTQSAPQPYYPSPQAYPPQPPRKKSSACVWIGLAGILVICVVVVAALLIFGILNFNLLKNPQQILSWLQGGGTTSTAMVTGNDVITISSGESGSVSSGDGASIYIPAGTVPLTQDGEIGSMSFSINHANNMTVSLPAEYKPIGPVYELGPEGFTFNSPVTITLPIPEGVDPKKVFGLTYYDSVDGTWKLVPGAIDQEARTVTAMTTHFSYWSLFGGSTTTWFDNNGGYIEVINDHSYNSGSFDGGRHMPEGITYGVCIESYTLDNPQEEINWTPPFEWKMLVSDYRSEFAPITSDHSNDWWVPSGSYNLTEVIHTSEINNDPLYVPAFTTYYRSIGQYTVDTGGKITFRYSSTPGESEFIEGRPDCFGVKDTSVGTGDVQITLTWQRSIDLDLHVIDPTGEEIYYAYTTSSSGGQLDRDNLCDNMIIGRPENIYWPSDAAPSGTYTVKVNYYGECDEGGSVSYTVRIVVQGNVDTYSGTISSGTQEVATFTVP